MPQPVGEATASGRGGRGGVGRGRRGRNGAQVRGQPTGIPSTLVGASNSPGSGGGGGLPPGEFRDALRGRFPGRGWRCGAGRVSSPSRVSGLGIPCGAYSHLVSWEAGRTSDLCAGVVDVGRCGARVGDGELTGSPCYDHLTARHGPGAPKEYDRMGSRWAGSCGCVEGQTRPPGLHGFRRGHPLASMQSAPTKRRSTASTARTSERLMDEGPRRS